DKDLADLYGVKARRLREQVKRNLNRFPADFMFKLSKTEADLLVSHFATPSRKQLGGHLPYVFTEHGALMLSSVLRTRKAAEVGILVVRAFVKVREILSTHKDLANKLKELEQRVKNHDGEIYAIFAAIRKLMTPLKTTKNKIGFLK
ncbi:MAG: ORF6N domain-containing protein, partial [Candidatus Margulisbacteria bacterium]|nr:ORF6N domain-containing protein [Candidatus Margulisiibacteriota bacterium]